MPVKCQAAGDVQPRGGEVTEVLPARREPVNRVTVNFGDIEIASLVEGQASGSV